jgi:putative flavoprotein involved in K+ transport
MVQLPVVDADGFPLQTGGITSYPGLYFVGIPWMPGEDTGFLLGFGKICNRVASAIAAA